MINKLQKEKTIKYNIIQYCCEDLENAIKIGNLKLEEKQLNLYVVNSNGYSELTYCPFCGKKIKD